MFKPTKSGILSRILGADSVGEKRDLVGRSDGKQALFVTSDGKVGIGTTLPGTILEIAGPESNNYVYIKNTTPSSGNGNRWNMIHFRGLQIGGTESTLASIVAEHDGASDDQKGRIHFRTNSGAEGSAPTSRMTILNDGKVGIGNTNPLKHLDIYTADTSNREMYIRNSTVNGLFKIVGTTEFQVGTETSHHLKFITSNNVRMTILQDGFVGIGTTNPQYGFDLKGRMQISNATSETDTIMYWSTNNVTKWSMILNSTNSDRWFLRDADATHGVILNQNSDTWSAYSDVRLKSNIHDLPDGLNVVLQIKPRTYQYLDEQRISVGFIAQELKNVLPSAVHGEEIPFDEKDTIHDKLSKALTVSDTMIIPYLVKSIQELSAKVDALEAKLG